MAVERLNTHQKALRINLDTTKHGAFAEIGAGQEVARWFFHVGGAAGTVARTVSAYDMAVSDDLYGPADRYVSRERLLSMLDREYRGLINLLGPKRGDSTSFFVFADTMATRSYSRHEEGHGWLGIRFQHHPGARPSEIVLHVWMRDGDNSREQEAIGILGVNLIHAACYMADSPEEMTESLLDNLGRRRIEIDTLKFSGPCFAELDNRLTALNLVERDMTGATIFTAAGEVVQPSEVLYGKPVLIGRGTFRPVSNATLAILERAENAFRKDVGDASREPVALMEMSIHNLLERSKTIDYDDFLIRAQMLGAAGQSVLVSGYGPFYPIPAYLRRYTRAPIAFGMGIPSVVELFRDDYYQNLDGGILEALGRLFHGDVRIYAFPVRDASSGEPITLRNLEVPPGVRSLFRHLMDNGRLVDLGPADGALFESFPQDIRQMIARGDPAWEKLVPEAVAEIIRSRRYLGWGGRSR